MHPFARKWAAGLCGCICPFVFCVALKLKAGCWVHFGRKNLFCILEGGAVLIPLFTKVQANPNLLTFEGKRFCYAWDIRGVNLKYLLSASVKESKAKFYPFIRRKMKGRGNKICYVDRGTSEVSKNVTQLQIERRDKRSMCVQFGRGAGHR